MRLEVFCLLLWIVVILAVMVIVAVILLLGDRQETEQTEPTALWRVELWNIRQGHRVELRFENTCVVGRATVMVPGGMYPEEPDNTISREHCVLCEQAGVLMVWNLSTVNPAVLNGYRVNTPQRIMPGDRLELGNSVFLVTIVERQC